MRPLSVDEVRPPSRYEAVRAEELERAIEDDVLRSVRVGDLITVVFENRRTVALALEEQLRAGQVEDPARIAEEVAIFNALIPGDGELAATLYVDTEDAADLARRLRELPGLAGAVHLEVDGVRAERVGDVGVGTADAGESVRHLRFRLGREQCVALAARAEVALRCDHPLHRARTLLDDRQRAALAEDLAR